MSYHVSTVINDHDFCAAEIIQGALIEMIGLVSNTVSKKPTEAKYTDKDYLAVCKVHHPRSFRLCVMRS